MKKLSQHKVEVQIKHPEHSKSYENLIKKLNDNKMNIRLAAAEALAGFKLTNKSAKPLTDCLKNDPSIKVRCKAALSLAFSLDNQAFDLIAGLLYDHHYMLRETAIECLHLSLLRDDKRSAILVENCLKDRHWAVRKAAANALGFIGDKRVLKSLRECLKDECHEVRAEAIQSLGFLKDKTAIESIIAALKDKNERVRHNAALALNDIRDRRAIEPLKQRMKDKSAYVRYTAEGVLKQYTRYSHYKTTEVPQKTG